MALASGMLPDCAAAFEVKKGNSGAQEDQNGLHRWPILRGKVLAVTTPVVARVTTTLAAGVLPPGILLECSPERHFEAGAGTKAIGTNDESLRSRG